MSRQEHGGRLREEAERLLRELRAEQVAPEEAPSRGQVFLLGHHLRRNMPEIQRNFSASFAARLTAMEIKRWRLAESAYGLHLVWIHERRDKTVAPLNTVREQVVIGIANQQRQQRHEQTIAELRRRYPVVVEKALIATRWREGAR